MLSLLLASLIVGMCGFCHAPEHAYDVLADDPTVSRDEIATFRRTAPRSRGPQDTAASARTRTSAS